MVKSKLLPYSGSVLETVEPHLRKGAIKFFFSWKKKIEHRHRHMLFFPLSMKTLVLIKSCLIVQVFLCLLNHPLLFGNWRSILLSFVIFFGLFFDDHTLLCKRFQESFYLKHLIKHVHCV